jgi:hypothetical protein
MGRLLRLDEGQWLAIIIPEEIIDVADTRVCRLVRNLDLFAYLAGALIVWSDFPAGAFGDSYVPQVIPL